MSAKTRKPRSTRTAALNGRPTTDEVLTLAEAAVFLKVPEAGLKADAVAGRVPGQLVAGEWRFYRAGLLAWLTCGEQSSKLANNALIEHIRKKGVSWSTESEREAEAFIAGMKTFSPQK